MKPAVFLTGATGFLGMEVLARLLEAGDREVLALVRAPDDAAAEQRLDGVLATLWDDPAPYRERVTAVRGELTQPGLGLDDRARRDRGAHARGAALRGVDLVRPAAAGGARDQRRRHLARARLRDRGAGARRARALPARLDRVRERPPRGRVPRAPARHRPVVPQHLRADQGRRRADRGDGARARARDRAAEHRDGRERLGLDAGVQRPLLADAGVLARAVQGAAGAADRARRHRAGRLRRRRPRAPARPPRGRRVQPRGRAQRVDRRRADHARVGVLQQAACRRSSIRSIRTSATITTRSTCRTSTCGSCSTTPAPAPCWCPRASRRRRCATTSRRLMDYAQAARWGKKTITREAARARSAELAAT